MKMKNPNKRIIALILALAMSMSLSAPAWAAEQESDTSAAQVETQAESAAEEAPEENPQASETAEVSAPAEESTEEPEEEAAQVEPQAEEPEEEAAPQQDEETEAPAQEEAQPEEAAEAEESAQEPQEPQKDADEALAPQEDEEMSYEWQIYKKFLEYQKAGKAADFAYHFTLDGCTVEMTPVGNGVYDAHITGKGECTTAYKAYVTGADETIGFERSFYEYGKVVRNGIECTSIRLKTPEPDSVKELKKELGVSSLDKRYNQPKIRNLTFGSEFSSIGVMAGFFGKTSVEKMVVPSNIKTIAEHAFFSLSSSCWTFGVIEFINSANKYCFCG